MKKTSTQTANVKQVKKPLHVIQIIIWSMALIVLVVGGVRLIQGGSSEEPTGGVAKRLTQASASSSQSVLMGRQEHTILYRVAKPGETWSDPVDVKLKRFELSSTGEIWILPTLNGGRQKPPIKHDPNIPDPKKDRLGSNIASIAFRSASNEKIDVKILIFE